MSAACLFLAAKVEEQPRKLEFVIRAAHHIVDRPEDGSQPPPLDTTSQVCWTSSIDLYTDILMVALS